MSIAIQVPKSIVLSVASTGIANILEEEDIEGYVGLTLACMYELSRGSESLWSAYLSLLNNRRPQMASDLSEEARELMKKSEVHADIETDLVSFFFLSIFSALFFFFCLFLFVVVYLSCVSAGLAAAFAAALGASLAGQRHLMLPTHLLHESAC